jgi:dUTP pyrophosphatase
MIPTITVELKYKDSAIAALYGEDGGTPLYKTKMSVAVDIRSPQTFQLVKGRGPLDIRSGLFIHPQYFVAELLIPRSGIGRKGLKLTNTMGLIDADYQGEIIVSCIYQPTDEQPDTLIIERGERFAQLFFIPAYQAIFNVVDEFSAETERGSGGFGHTGRH